MIPPPAAAAFLAAHGWGGAAVLPVAGDASFRRYFRVLDGARSAILMDAPPPHEDPRGFIAVARWLSEHGFAAPTIEATDLEQGLVLLEDFGDVRMRETVDADAAQGPALYATAIDMLVRLHALPAAPVPPYDRAVLHREANLLTEWYCPTVGVAPDQAAYDAVWDAVFDHALARPGVTVLRDYHAENLMLLPGGTPERALGLLDFQDALVGHPAYDLVSLLQDARRDVDESVEAEMLARYKAAIGGGADAAFDTAYHVLGAQRNAKIIGIFTRLWQRDGKPRYAALCPRVWRYLERDLAHPALAPVKAWFDATLPPELRGDPTLVRQDAPA
ncbi:aminoglycoside phosphotransferase family protein [Sphingomonas sp. PAMC 26605]|uniref:aminoglycoside phosphotransferase family protein n=1 Tax=Sphingomonas sp. PAMC 26605 TaxID=1112214 RepID=UPI00026CCBAD|nr:phosphotransferase [Sphingomonas sp. PAMC 26605]